MLSEVRERKARNCGSAPCVAKGLPVKIAGAAGRFRGIQTPSVAPRKFRLGKVRINLLLRATFRIFDRNRLKLQDYDLVVQEEGGAGLSGRYGDVPRRAADRLHIFQTCFAGRRFRRAAHLCRSGRRVCRLRASAESRCGACHPFALRPSRPCGRRAVDDARDGGRLRQDLGRSVRFRLLHDGAGRYGRTSRRNPRRGGGGL